MAAVMELLAALTIERISFAYGVELLANDGTVIRLEGEGSIASEGMPPLTFDTEAARPAAFALLGFLHSEASLSLDDATLELSIADTALVLRVPPSAEYEAWSVVLADGSRLVSMPGGAVARWAAT